MSRSAVCSDTTSHLTTCRVHRSARRTGTSRVSGEASRQPRAGVNERAHEVALDVADPTVWGRADLDLVVDLVLLRWDPQAGRGIEIPTKYHLRIGDSGPCTSLLLCGSSGKLIASVPAAEVMKFLGRAYARAMAADPAPRSRPKVIPITSAEDFRAVV